MCGHLEWNRGSWNHCSSYRSNWFGNHCTPRCGSLWFHCGHNHAHSYSHGSSGKPFWRGLGWGLASGAMNLLYGWLGNSSWFGGGSWFSGNSWFGGGNSWFGGGSPWLGGGNSWFGGPSWQNGGSWYSSNQPQTPGQNTTIVNNGNIDTETLAGFNNRFDQITKPGYSGPDTLEQLKNNIKAKIATQDDGVQNSNDIINYEGLLRAIELYKRNNSSSNPVNQNDDAILSAVDSLTYANVQGYTDAEEDDLLILNAGNVDFARDVEGYRKTGPQKIKDISGIVTVENNGMTIKIKDSGLNGEITYKCIGKANSGKMVYVDTTSNSKQVYILQRNTNGKYALMQYDGMDGSNEKAHSPSSN